MVYEKKKKLFFVIYHWPALTNSTLTRGFRCTNICVYTLATLKPSRCLRVGATSPCSTMAEDTAAAEPTRVVDTPEEDVNEVEEWRVQAEAFKNEGEASLVCVIVPPFTYLLLPRV